ncbi:MAG: class II fructose-bisphosphate aldolase, partial [Clostridia bacterium]|nr:class II fructose-bisphosphate aldolase [Clostridia bacterium]
YKGTPNVRFDLFDQIKRRVACPLVVHGGTGLSEDVFRKLVAAGAAKINISTAIKIAYCEGMLEYTAAHVDENNPLRLDRFVTERVKACVSEHIRTFGSEQKA